MSEFGDRLREERDRLGLTQAELGEKGGVKKNAQSAYEIGERSPDAAYLTNIGLAGVDVPFLFTGLRSRLIELSEVEQFILDTYRRIDVYAKDGINILFERLAAVKYEGNEYPRWRSKTG